jgi:hypothetical protein
LAQLLSDLLRQTQIQFPINYHPSSTLTGFEIVPAIANLVEFFPEVPTSANFASRQRMLSLLQWW